MLLFVPDGEDERVNLFQRNNLEMDAGGDFGHGGNVIRHFACVEE